MSPRVPSLIGHRFCRLTVVAEAGRDKHRRLRYLCQCDCGNGKVVERRNLIANNTKSCGCLHKEALARLHQQNVGRGKRKRLNAECMNFGAHNIPMTVEQKK